MVEESTFGAQVFVAPMATAAASMMIETGFGVATSSSASCMPDPAVKLVLLLGVIKR